MRRTEKQTGFSMGEAGSGQSFSPRLLIKLPVHGVGQDYGEDVGDELGPDKTVHSEETVQKQKERDIEHQLPGCRQEEGYRPAADRLEKFFAA